MSAKEQLAFTQRRKAYAQYPLRTKALYKGRPCVVVGHESADSPHVKPLVIEFVTKGPRDPTHADAADLEAV
jgi:hypothetical protein